MRFTLAALAMPLLAYAFPGGVTSAIAPAASSPAGCSENYSGAFEIEVVNVSTVSTKRATVLTITLKDGVLTDEDGRTGYIASNYQFQFDDPPQAGAIYTAGWSVCSNGTLALGGSAIFYECLSGTFYNLYDESTGAQCTAIYIDVIAVSSSSTTAAASVISDGQVTASPVTQITDGQVQATSAVVTQISDGQVQATTKTTTGAVVTQISDGQVQATTKTTTGAVVTQISDGQVQATTAKSAVSQISDGQIQASAGSNTTVSAATVTSSTAKVASQTGAAGVNQVAGGLVAAGVFAVLAL